MWLDPEKALDTLFGGLALRACELQRLDISPLLPLELAFDEPFRWFARTASIKATIKCVVVPTGFDPFDPRALNVGTILAEVVYFPRSCNLDGRSLRFLVVPDVTGEGAICRCPTFECNILYCAVRSA